MSTSIPEVYKKGWHPPLQEQSGTPGKQQGEMDPHPLDFIMADGREYRPSGKFEGRSALITGGDSGIGRAVSILFAMEGADVTIAYKPGEEEDAKAVEKAIAEKTGGKRKVVHGAFDLRKEHNAKELVKLHLKEHGGKLDSLILNHGTQAVNSAIHTLPTDQWHDVFDTNIHSFFYMVKAALPHITENTGTIVFDASVNPFKGHPGLVDYTATKGAIVGFARALSNQIVGEKGIRVNVVAPGPIWTPLIPATMSEDSRKQFGLAVPIGRPGQPVEVATSFVFLGSTDSSFMSGQVLHPNGGTIIA